MRNIIWSNIKRRYIPWSRIAGLIFLLSSLSSNLNATHIRAGEITVERLDCVQLTFRITITGWTDLESTVHFGGGELNFGDGSLAVNLESVAVLTLEQDLGDNVGIVQYQIEHTYDSNGEYIISYLEANRNAGILNMGNSIETTFYLEIQLVIDSFVGCNKNTPVLLIPPLDEACVGVIFYHNSGAWDPDGDSLSYKLIVPRRDKDLDVHNYHFPNDALFGGTTETGEVPTLFEINSTSGEIIWNAPGTAGEYNIAFVISEWRTIQGVVYLLSQTTRDMQIIVKDCENKRPQLQIPQDLFIVAEDSIEVTITGIDPDGDEVSLEAYGGPFKVDSSPATFSPFPPQFDAQPAEGTFSWQTNANHIRQQPYQITFKVTDKPPSGPNLVDFKSWNIWVLANPLGLDEDDPKITSYVLPDLFSADSSSITASVNVEDNVGIGRVSFYSRIANENVFVGINLPSISSVFEYAITKEFVTDIGLEYFFLVSVIQYTEGNGPIIPNLSSGGRTENWRMFSIPFILGDSTIAGLFESNLGTYDKSKWRIIHYKNDFDKFVEYKLGLEFVQRGKGYWFNSVLPALINLNGSLPGASKKNLSTIELQQGWNQIGNPYNFDVSWSNVINFNSVIGIGGLRVFKGGTSLVDSNVLKAFGGAYVFAGESSSLKIPFEQATTSSITKHNEEDEWILNINVELDQFKNLISGLGMQHGASQTKDQYDRIRVPRYLKYVDITFEHEEFYAPHFAMDVVPVSIEYTWEFSVSTNVEGPRTTISWNQLNLDQNLYLYDPEYNILIDMKRESEYGFETVPEKRFKVIFGDEKYVSEELERKYVLLGRNYPNPFDGKTTIPITILGGDNPYHLKMDIYSLEGVKIKTLIDMNLNFGTHAFEWDQKDESGKTVSPGIYIYQLEVTSDKEQSVYSEKMIIK